MYIRTLIIATLLSAPAFTHAQSRFDPTPQHRTCMSYASSMADRRRCDSEEIERQKALLNAEYRIVTNGISQPAKERLDRAQKAWVEFRDLDCQSKSAAIQGSGGADSYNDCMLQHIKIRKYQLENYFSL